MDPILELIRPEGGVLASRTFSAQDFELKQGLTRLDFELKVSVEISSSGKVAWALVRWDDDAVSKRIFLRNTPIAVEPGDTIVVDLVNHALRRDTQL